MSQTLPNARLVLAELIVRDNLAELNSALSLADVEPSDVVSIIPIPRVTPAIGDHEPKLRVIYRASV